MDFSDQLSMAESKVQSDHLRKTTNADEILSVLEEIKNLNTHLTIWQKTETSRLILKGIIYEINPRYVCIVYNAPDNKYASKDQLNIYFHGPFKSLLFKGKILSVEENRIMIEFPHELALHEYRTHPRYITKGLNLKIVIPDKKLGRKIVKTFPMLDISQGGVSCLVTKKDLPDFDRKTERF